MFAGSCIAVVFLVILLEFLRRAGKEFDRFIVRQAQQQAAALRRASEAHDGGASPANSKGACAVAGTDADSGDQKSAFPFPSMKASAGTFRPNLWQQAVRATLHLFQFSVAYFVMLLAMYYNVRFLARSRLV
jgi:copper transporter 1